MMRKFCSTFSLIIIGIAFLISLTASGQGILTITIPPGATLSGLAIEHGTTISVLMTLNPKIKDPNLIYAGDELKVPPATTIITIAQGATLFSLAIEYNTTIPVLLALNPQIKDQNLIYAGDMLFVPKPVSTSAPSLPPTPTPTTSEATTTQATTTQPTSTEITLPPSPPPPPPSGPPLSCQDQYASGAQTYSVTTKSIPTIYQIVVDPLNVNYSASQTVNASVRDTNGNPITSISGSAITDTKSVNFTLTRVSGTETDGVWQGTWVLKDSICQNFQVSVSATSQSGTSNVVLTFK